MNNTINLCPMCNTMKHLTDEGVCGRCKPSEVETLNESWNAGYAELEYVMPPPLFEEIEHRKAVPDRN